MEVALAQAPERAITLGELLLVGLAFYGCYKLALVIYAGLACLLVGGVAGCVAFLLYDRYEPFSQRPGLARWQHWIRVQLSPELVFVIAGVLMAIIMYLTWNASLFLLDDAALDVCKQIFTGKKTV